MTSRYECQEGETYLGDGLYVSERDDNSVILRAPRLDTDHWVALEPHVLDAFMKWLRIQRREAGDGG